MAYFRVRWLFQTWFYVIIGSLALIAGISAIVNGDGGSAAIAIIIGLLMLGIGWAMILTKRRKQPGHEMTGGSATGYQTMKGSKWK